MTITPAMLHAVITTAARRRSRNGGQGGGLAYHVEERFLCVVICFTLLILAIIH